MDSSFSLAGHGTLSKWVGLDPLWFQLDPAGTSEAQAGSSWSLRGSRWERFIPARRFWVYGTDNWVQWQRLPQGKTSHDYEYFVQETQNTVSIVI